MSKSTSKKAQGSGQMSKGQPICRLFLATPTNFKTNDMVPLLKAALENGDVACLLIGHEDSAELEKAADIFTPLAQAKDVAVLIEGSIETVQKSGADGIVVAGFQDDYKKARQVLGDDKIVGVDCGVDRHSAMALGEAGADFVIFDDEDSGHHQDEIDTQTPTQLSKTQVNEPVGNWWARVFEVPCVIMAPQSNANAVASIKSGVEFLCPTSQMWENVKTAENTVKQFNQMIKDTPVDEG